MNISALLAATLLLSTPAQGLLVPAGTTVPVHLLGSIDSGSARPGDVLQIAADGASGNGHSGSIGLAWLSDVEQKQSEDDRKGVSSTATEAAVAPHYDR